MWRGGIPNPLETSISLPIKIAILLDYIDPSCRALWSGNHEMVGCKQAILMGLSNNHKIYLGYNILIYTCVYHCYYVHFIIYQYVSVCFSMLWHIASVTETCSPICTPLPRASKSLVQPTPFRPSEASLDCGWQQNLGLEGHSTWRQKMWAIGFSWEWFSKWL